MQEFERRQMQAFKQQEVQLIEDNKEKLAQLAVQLKEPHDLAASRLIDEHARVLGAQTDEEHKHDAHLLEELETLTRRLVRKSCTYAEV
jgi:hypothetical protein